MEIRKKLNVWRAAWLFLRTAGLALECLTVVLWLAVPAAAADLVFGLTRDQRLLFTALAAVWLSWRVIRGFAAFLPDLRLLRFAALVEEALPELNGRLVSALDLSLGPPPPGSSPEFVRRHLEDADGLLRTSRRPNFISFKKLLPPRRLVLLVTGICAAAVAAWSDPGVFSWFLNPLAPRPLENILDIRPGDASVIKNRPFRIEAAYKNGGEEEPELQLRSPGEPWSRGFMTDVGQGRFVYAGVALETDLLYRLRHKELQSRTYRLTADDPPALDDHFFSVVPPAYAGQESFSYPYLPSETEVLKGSLISVSGVRNDRLFAAALVFEGGPVLPLRETSGGRISAEFTAEDDIAYRLSLKNQDGVEAGNEARNLIKAVEDRPPSVEMLSPAFGSLEAAPEEEIDAVYEASDDIGLREIRLVRKTSVSGKPAAALSFDVQIRTFAGSTVRRASGGAELPLYDIPDGAEAEFYFSACDRSPPGHGTGTGCSASGAAKIKITDFSGRHAVAYAGLDALKKELASLKARESGIISDLEKGRVFTASEMADYASAWRKTAEAAKRLGVRLKKDPYMGAGTLARYDLFRDDISYGAETAEKKAVPGTLSGSAGAAAGIHRKLKSSLERGERDLESIMRSEDARSSVAGFGSMARKATDMAGELSSAASGSEADWRKLSRTLEKISAELERIKSMLSDRPPQKSDGRVFALPAGRALEAAGALAGAIRERNAEKAAALAARLAEKLSQMRRVMEEYASYRASQDSQWESEEQANELSERWQVLYEAQKAATEAGRGLEEKLLVKIEKARGVLLAEVFARLPGMAAELASVEKDAPGVYLSVVSSAERLKAGDAGGAHVALQSALFGIEKSTCVPCARVLRTAGGKIRAAIIAVSRLASDAALLAPSDLAMFPSAARKQEKIRSDSVALSAHISGVYYGALAGWLLEKLENAGGHMAAAADALTSNNIKPAVEEQLKALNELELGGQSLDDALDKMSSASAGMGASGMGSSSRTSGVFMRRASGLNTSPVKLPKAEDYVPPARLREKVMESLKERYPSSRKDLIEGYLKNIAE